MLTEAKQKLLTEGSFARHETFCPRYGWLKKGVDSAHEDEEIFGSEKDIEILGVGKNMVRSIKYWCTAFKLLEVKMNGKKAGKGVEPTDFARKLIFDEGWDPYIEDPATLWLLHWQLFMPPILAPSWSMAVNLTNIQSFTIKALKIQLLEYKQFIPSIQRFSDSSFEKDASCFVRMYGPPSKNISDEIECPFTQLGFLSLRDKKGAYHFNMEEKPNLPDLILLAACFDYADKFHPTSNALSLNAIAYGFNSPGVVFRLSETDIGHRLENACLHFDEISFAETYGNRQLLLEAPSTELRETALEKYYANSLRMSL